MPASDLPPGLSPAVLPDPLPGLDPDWYGQAFPDVALSGLTPEDHYHRFGRLLGRPGSAAAQAARRGQVAENSLEQDHDAPSTAIHPLLAPRDPPPPPGFGPVVLERAGAIIPAPPDLAHRADPPLRPGLPPRPAAPATRALHHGGHLVARAPEGADLSAPLALLAALTGAGPAPEGLVTLAAGPALRVDPGTRLGRFPLSDVWFATGLTLRLAFAEPVFRNTDPAAPGTPGTGAVLRAWQARPGGGLACAGGAVLPLEGPGFCDLTLGDPLMPVLLDLACPQGTTLALALLPFPSLARGGLHGAELVALAGGAPEALWRLSAGLLAEFLGPPPGQGAGRGSGVPVDPDADPDRSGAPAPGRTPPLTATPPRALGRLQVAAQGAVGTEPVFAPEVTGWLAAIFGLVPVLTGANPADPGQAWLAQALGQEAGLVAARAPGPLCLTLPPDSLPTLAALVSRRLAVPVAGGLAGSWLIADAVTRDPLWSVAMPGLAGGVLAGVQPRHGALSGPLLEGPVSGPGAGRLATGAAGLAPVPLAVAYRFRAPRNEAQMMMPCAPDAPGGVLQAMAQRSLPLPPLSIALAVSDAGAWPGALPAAVTDCLRSIARQEGLGAVELILCLPQTTTQTTRQTTPPANPAPLAAQAAALLPGAVTVVLSLPPGPPDLAPADLAPPDLAPPDLDRIAACAAHATILLISDQTLLHDPRTLGVLATLLAADPAIASASCLLLREPPRRGAALEAGPGGVFPAQISFIGAPRLVVTEPDCLEILPNATYPVLANGLDLMLVTRAALGQAAGRRDGLSGAAPGGADLRFGLEALACGRMHLCTTAITATSLRPAGPRRDQMDPWPGPHRWDDILARVTTLARVV